LPTFKRKNNREKKELIDYRNWCLKNILYLNPLNDLGSLEIACNDCINIPSIISNLKRPPIYFSLFNQMKQEYGTARYFLYNSFKNNRPHFSDEDVVIIDTLDNSQYSFYIENLKISFRLAYSILDKIAYLLNDYLKLGIPSHKISFKSLWFNNYKDKELLPLFKNSTNWALRGLYWLSKDLYEKDDDFDTVIEPEAQKIAKIRNFIEHKSFKVISDDSSLEDIFEFDLDISYVISRSVFEAKTLKLLKLARASIIYLSIALNDEEKNNFNSETGPLPKINLKEVPFFKKK